MDEETRKKLEEWNKQVGERTAGNDVAPSSGAEQAQNSAFYNPLTANTLPAGSQNIATPPLEEEVPLPKNPSADANEPTAKNETEERVPAAAAPIATPERQVPNTPPQPQNSPQTKMAETTSPETSLKEETERDPMKPPTNLSSEQIAPTKNPLEESALKKREQDKNLLSRIRTYESDAAEAINRKKTTLSSMIIAKDRAREDKAEGSTSRKTSKALLYTLLSVVLIAGGVGVVYGWYAFVYVPQNQPVTTYESNTLIPSNETEEVLFNFQDRGQLASFLTDKKNTVELAKNEVYSVLFVEEVIPAEGEGGTPTTQPITARAFLETLSVNAPLPLYRSLEPEFTYGVYAASDVSRPFLIFKTSLYQNAFASMLSWEQGLTEDLDFLVPSIDAPTPPPPAEPKDNVATTTAATSTDEAPNDEEFLQDENLDPLPNPQFEDEVIRNHDARVLRDASGNIRLLYSFVNESTLVITNNTETLEEIFRRMTLVEFE